MKNKILKKMFYQKSFGAELDERVDLLEQIVETQNDMIRIQQEHIDGLTKLLARYEKT
jgi:hypothetical protein